MKLLFIIGKLNTTVLVKIIFFLINLLVPTGHLGDQHINRNNLLNKIDLYDYLYLKDL